ncbi:WG repeat-containing protein [Allofournierella massiliensis]|uniref:WG repeat-containing protein n=1 Tax=Allofournierella massiliensis TaxID=1650663 RepID=UPI00356812E2
MNKKWIAAALAVCLAVSFTACKKSNDGYDVTEIGPEKTSAPSTAQPQPSAEPTATPKPQAGFVVGPVKDIDIVASLSDYSAPSQTQLSLEEREQLAFFTQNGKTGVIDLKGNIVIPAEKDVHWCPVCGITNEGETEIYNAKGEVIGSGGHGAFEMPMYYDKTSGGLYVADTGTLIPWDSTMVNTLEPMIVTVTTTTSTTTEDANWKGYSLKDESNPVLLSEGEGYRLFKPDGTALNDQVYEEIQRASTGTFAVKQNGLWGYVNQETGEEMVPCQYLEALPFNGDRAAVKAESGWGYISLTGRQKTSMEFLGAASAADESTAWVRTAEGWGVVNLSDYPVKAN